MPRLPASGPLSIEQINAEFKRGAQFANYLGAPHDVGNFPTANLALSHFHGRMAAFSVEHYTTGTETWDLYWWTRGLGWDGIIPVRGVYGLQGGAVVAGNSNRDPAILIHGFPANSQITIVNHGTIAGRGGSGAPGGGTPTGGGTCMYIRSAVTIHNHGVIGSGGGGGASNGLLAGGGGAYAGPPNGGLHAGGPGQGPLGGVYGNGRGGKGGDLGQFGQGWFDYNGAGPFQQGAAPGWAIDGNGLVTWAVYGDVRGPVG